MVIHIALFRWKPEFGEADIDAVMADIRRLKQQIPEVIDLTSGVNFGPYSEGYTHAVVVTLKDRNALATYRDHTMHRPVAEAVDRMYEQSIGIDFEA